MWRDAWLVAGKDLHIEARSKIALNQVVPFAAVIVLLFGLALGPNPSSLRAAAPGLFWIAVLLSSVLAVQRAFSIEASDSARDGLRLLGLDPGGVFLGKALAVCVELVALEAVLAVLTALLFQSPLHEGVVLFGSCVLGTLGLSAIGTTYGVLAIGSKVRDTLLPLLFFPVVAPVLIAATKVWQDALAGRSGGGWLGLLAVFALVYLAVGTVVFGPLLEDA